MQDGINPVDASEGGSKPPSPTFFKKSFEGKLRDLESIAEAKGLKEEWNQIVTPWWTQTRVSTAKVIVASETSTKDACCSTLVDLPRAI